MPSGDCFRDRFAFMHQSGRTRGKLLKPSQGPTINTCSFAAPLQPAMRSARLLSPLSDRFLRNCVLQPSTSGSATTGTAFDAVLVRLLSAKPAGVPTGPDASKGFKDGGFEVTHFPRDRVCCASPLLHGVQYAELSDLFEGVSNGSPATVISDHAPSIHSMLASLSRQACWHHFAAVYKVLVCCRSGISA